MAVGVRVKNPLTGIDGRFRGTFLLGVLIMIAVAGLADSQGIPFDREFFKELHLLCPSGIAFCMEPGGGTGISEPSPTTLTFRFTASPALCSSVQVAVSIDDTLLGTSAFLAPGQSMTPLTAQVAAGTHFVHFRPTFQNACISQAQFVFGTGGATISQPPVAVGAPALSSWALVVLAASLAGLPALMKMKAARNRA